MTKNSFDLLTVPLKWHGTTVYMNFLLIESIATGRHMSTMRHTPVIISRRPKTLEVKDSRD